MSRRNGKHIHGNQLKPSTSDHVALGIAIDDRFPVFCHRYEKTTGNQFVWSQSMDKDVLRWRQMRVRHKSGDYRHTDAELISMQLIAQFTVSENEKLCDQPASKPIEWDRRIG